MTVRIAVAPDDTFGIVAPLRREGVQIVAAEVADAIVWSAPRDPQGLRSTLIGSPARWVQVSSAGVDGIHRAGLLDGSRLWTSARGLYGQACAEHVLGLTLSAMRRIHVHARSRDNQAAPMFSAPERLLASQHVLIVGTGGIGSASARLFKAFGTRVTGVNRSGHAVQPFDTTAPVSALDDVLDEADVVVLCAPLTKATRGLFDANRFALMRDDAWLVNVARGELVVTADLVVALAAGTLAGAALDVTDPAVLPSEHALWTFDSVVITPHVAATWTMSRDLFVARAVRNARRFAMGDDLEGVVDQTHGY